VEEILEILTAEIARYLFKVKKNGGFPTLYD